MKKKDFTKNKNNNIPNSNIKKREETSLVRISQEAIDILKLNAVLEKTTMKDYLENLIYEDDKLKDKGDLK